jgi:Type III secretion system leucine rich repeat protein
MGTHPAQLTVLHPQQDQRDVQNSWTYSSLRIDTRPCFGGSRSFSTTNASQSPCTTGPDRTLWPKPWGFRCSHLHVQRVMRSTNLPASLMPRNRDQASASQDSLGSRATEPLRSPQSGALLNSDEEAQALAVCPRNYKEYCQQWDAWKNEAHPSNENRTDAVKRMKRWLTLAMAVNMITPKVSTPIPGARHSVIPRSSSFSTLDLSSLGLSSLPPWLPPARKVNLDNNRLTSVPLNLIARPVYRPQSLIDVESKIQLTNNPLPASEMIALQSIVDSSGYQGPKLVFSRPDTGTHVYEADRQLPNID